MLTALRNKLIFWVVVTAVAGAGAIYLTNAKSGDHSYMSFRVAFVPEHREDPVTVIIKFGAAIEYTDHAEDSPWLTSLEVPTGTTATMTATQANKTLLTCSILSRGTTYGPQVGVHNSKGSTCTVMATA